MTDSTSLHARVAHAHLIAERERAMAGKGRGASISGAAASQASPETLAPDETPATPKRVAPEFLSAVHPNLQKKLRKIPGVDRTCPSCYYAIANADGLTCHAKSPKPNPTTNRVIWPAVTATDWCGEWSDAQLALAYADDPETPAA